MYDELVCKLGKMTASCTSHRLTPLLLLWGRDDTSTFPFTISMDHDIEDEYRTVRLDVIHLTPANLPPPLAQPLTDGQLPAVLLPMPMPHAHRISKLYPTRDSDLPSESHPAAHTYGTCHLPCYLPCRSRSPTRIADGKDNIKSTGVMG